MRVLTLLESKKLLEKSGIPFAPSAIAKNFESASMIANNVGYPVVLKIISPKIIHKTESGAVEVNIRNDEDLEKAFNRMLQKFKKIPKEKLGGILVQKMVRGGEEVLVGSKKDPQFGHMIAFGLGGVFVEAMDDVSFRMVPIKKRDAEEMVREIKGYKILKGFRGKSYDVNSIEEILLKVSKFLEKNSDVSELDINPLIVSREGSIAVDARIVLE